MVRPLTFGVLGASWRRCGLEALSCKAIRSSTSLPSSASSVVPSLQRCVTRLRVLRDAGIPLPMAVVKSEVLSGEESGWWSLLVYGLSCCDRVPEKNKSTKIHFCSETSAFGCFAFALVQIHC